MSIPAIGGQALLAYVFTRADGPDAAAGWTHLRALWEACRLDLRMDAAVLEVAVSATLPLSVADLPAQSGVLAVCQRPDDGGVWEAFVCRDHDVICLAVLMAPDASDAADHSGRCAGNWVELEQRWTALQPDMSAPSLLGQAVVLLGLAPAGDAAPSVPVPVEVAGMVRHAVAGPATARCWQRPAATRHPFTLWEASASEDDGRPSRRIVAVAPESAEDDLYRWIWTPSDRRLAPFGRYLLHAAKLRHQLRVFDDGRSFRQIHAEVDAAVDDLLRLHLSTDPTTIPLSQVQQASIRLASVQAGTTGLVVVSTRLREIARTVDIARTNMAALLTAAGVSDSPAGLFADDRGLAQWCTDRLTDEQVYLDAARERARDVADATAGVVGQRLAKYQERMTMLQTSMLGALLMALGAMQALNYRLQAVPSVAHAPLIVLLAALALALPFWVPRLHPTTRDGALPGTTDHVMIAAVGAAAGWLTVAWVTSGHHGALGMGWSILAAVGGAALTVTVTALIVINRRARAS